MVSHPSIQFNPIESNPSRSDWNFNQVWAHLSIKDLAAHAKIGRCDTQSDDAWGEIHE